MQRSLSGICLSFFIVLGCAPVRPSGDSGGQASTGGQTGINSGQGGSGGAGSAGGSGGSRAVGGSSGSGGTGAVGGSGGGGGGGASGSGGSTADATQDAMARGGSDSAGGGAGGGGGASKGGAGGTTLQTGGVTGSGGKSGTGGTGGTGGKTGSGGTSGTGGASGTGGSTAPTPCSFPSDWTPGSPTYTTYDLPNPATACGYTGSTNNIANIAVGSNYAAIPGQSPSNFDTSSRCGACVQIGSAIITIVDECPYDSASNNQPCANNPKGHLDSARPPPARPVSRATPHSRTRLPGSSYPVRSKATSWFASSPATTTRCTSRT